MYNNIVVGEASCLLIPHDLRDEAVLVMYSYQTNQNQCVRICNTYSKLETVILDVPRGFILGRILFNLSIDDLIFFLFNLSMVDVFLFLCL